LQLIERLIEAECHRNLGAGADQSLMDDSLCVADTSALGLELESVAAAVVDDEDIGHPGKDAERLEDRGLDRPAEAAIGDMEKEGIGKAAHVQVLDNGALDLGLGEGLALAGLGHIPSSFIRRLLQGSSHSRCSQIEPRSSLSTISEPPGRPQWAQVITDLW